MSDTDNSPSIEEQVNNVLANVGEDGKIPEDIDPMLRFAATAEKRRRDTQSAYTKTTQENKRLAAENTSLATAWEQDATSTLSAKEQTELEELKSQDPDAWHARLNELKDTKKTALAARRQEISEEANQATTLAERETALEAFNEANPEFAITDEVIENDIPPRLTKKLASGEMEFGDFLEACRDYLSKDKVIQQPPQPDKSLDLDKVPGGSRPSEASRVKQDKDDYNNEIY